MSDQAPRSFMLRGFFMSTRRLKRRTSIAGCFAPNKGQAKRAVRLTLRKSVTAYNYNILIYFFSPTSIIFMLKIMVNDAKKSLLINQTH